MARRTSQWNGPPRAQLAFAFLGGLLLLSLTPIASAESAKPTDAETASPRSVRTFRWLDATYDFGDGNRTTFSGGVYANLDEEGNCNVCEHIRALSFGDVDGDGQEEALILFTMNLGGAGTLINGAIFALENGAPVLRAYVEGGDRGEGGLESMEVKNGVVVVRRYDLGDDGAVCCPKFVVIERWRWIDDRLQQVGQLRTVRRAPRPWWCGVPNRPGPDRPGRGCK